MYPHMGRALAALAPILCIGCPAGSATLTVRVQSGLRAGHEVRRVEAALFTGSSRCDGSSSIAVRRELGEGDQHGLGAGTLTIGEYAGLAPGVHALLVTAYRPEGVGHAELITRCIVVSFVNDRVVRVPLTTDCVALMCPLPGGSPSFTECLGGRCVDPRCDLDVPSADELCCDRTVFGDACDETAVRCTSSAGCDELLVCAGAPRCIDGVCVEGDADRCPPGEFCSATTRACETEPATSDAGAVSRDAGPVDVGGPLDSASAACPMGSPCMPGETRSCGNCDTGTRTCALDCRWGPCTGGGECAPGTTGGSCGNCGSGTQTCQSDCSWACAGDGCRPGSTRGACGNCMLGVDTCQEDCSYACVGGGECSPGATRAEVTGLCTPPCMTYAYTPTCDSSCTWQNVYTMRCMGGC